MEKKIGYKVLNMLNRTSCVVHTERVTYKKGIKAVPNKRCGPLCIFRTHRDAIDFYVSTIQIIVKCEYEESNKGVVWFANGDNRDLAMLPHGTILAASVTCIE